MAERSDLDELRARAGASDLVTSWFLDELLTECSDLDELRVRADAGSASAATRLAGLPAQRGDLDGAEQILRAQADADGLAAVDLAHLLAERGDLDGLRARADAGDEAAAEQLPGLLIKQGRGEEAERLRRFGLNPDGSIACA